jgi:hypothetical protein
MCSVGERPNREPGPLLTDRAAKGSGSCAGISLDAVIDAVREGQPEFADIEDLYVPDPNRGGDRSYIYAFATKDGGFALVFRRGAGDCLAGCIDNEYWYFRTDSACRPQALGHFLPRFAPSGCLNTEGFPLWDHPPPPDPTGECGNVVVSALSPLGNYTEHACGQLLPCATKATAPHALDFDLEFTVDVDPKDRQSIRLQLKNTGVPEIDGRPLAATLEGQRVRVVEHTDNLPSKCPEQHDLEVVIDPGGHEPSFVHYSASSTPDCAGAPDVYCKGSLQLDLGYLASNSCTAAADVHAAIATLRARPAGACEKDSDCTLLVLAGVCTGECPAVVRADQADELGKLFHQAAAAYCQDANCSDAVPTCPGQVPACDHNLCTLRIPGISPQP